MGIRGSTAGSNLSPYALFRKEESLAIARDVDHAQALFSYGSKIKAQLKSDRPHTNAANAASPQRAGDPGLTKSLITWSLPCMPPRHQIIKECACALRGLVILDNM